MSCASGRAPRRRGVSLPSPMRSTSWRPGRCRATRRRASARPRSFGRIVGLPYTRGSLTGIGASAPLLRRGLMGRLFVLLVVAALAGCVQSFPAAVGTPDEMTRAVSVDEIESMTVAVVPVSYTHLRAHETPEHLV